MSQVIARDHFEEVGVELQETARNLQQASDRFNGSCLRCTLFHRQADCKACPIREALKANIIWHNGQMENYPWIEKEMNNED